MTGAVAAILTVAAFATALLSGIFGMAGGLVLMGVLALLLPVSAAFVTHGILQLVANGWRAILHRTYVQWRIIFIYAAASTVAAGVVLSIAWAPSKPLLFFLLWLVSMLVWLPKSWVQLDAQRPWHAFASGLLVTLVNLTAGVAGPLLDVFFVRTALTRHEIVATKAATQVFSHLAKIVVYGGVAGSSANGIPPAWLFTLAVPASMLGTVMGGKVLDRMTDTDFKRWTAWIVTAIGLLYLIKAWQSA